jgi:hypothetical protein
MAMMACSVKLVSRLALRDDRSGQQAELGRHPAHAGGRRQRVEEKDREAPRRRHGVHRELAQHAVVRHRGGADQQLEAGQPGGARRHLGGNRALAVFAAPPPSRAPRQRPRSAPRDGGEEHAVPLLGLQVEDGEEGRAEVEDRVLPGARPEQLRVHRVHRVQHHVEGGAAQIEDLILRQRPRVARCSG